jgi:hypothetical protein
MLLKKARLHTGLSSLWWWWWRRSCMNWQGDKWTRWKHASGRDGGLISGTIHRPSRNISFGIATDYRLASELVFNSKQG